MRKVLLLLSLFPLLIGCKSDFCADLADAAGDCWWGIEDFEGMCREMRKTDMGRKQMALVAACVEENDGCMAALSCVSERGSTMAAAELESRIAAGDWKKALRACAYREAVYEKSEAFRAGCARVFTEGFRALVAAGDVSAVREACRFKDEVEVRIPGSSDLTIAAEHPARQVLQEACGEIAEDLAAEK